MTIAYLNDQFLPLAETKVSVLDRGFLFGDGVYEVIPVYNGHPFRLTQHLQRLQNSLAAIQLNLASNFDKIEKIIFELIKRNSQNQEGLIYLQCTRGPSSSREHIFPKQIKPTIFAYYAATQPKSIDELSLGIKAITVPDIRWKRCDIKAITLLPNILLRQQAIENHAQEAILINNGFAVEGSSTNLFIVSSGIIITPPISQQILGGITRDLILELAAQHHLQYRESVITEAQLFSADEIWLTSSSREIAPLIQLNDQHVGNGKAGPLWFKMIGHFQDFKSNYPA